jgi:hypothetical protein
MIFARLKFQVLPATFNAQIFSEMSHHKNSKEFCPHDSVVLARESYDKVN